MSVELVHTFNEQPITARAPDSYVNATELCKAAGKKWADYARLDGTDAFIQALAESTGIPIESLIQSKSGRTGGTWIHPRVAMHFCQWVSARFAVAVSGWVLQLLTTGRVELPGAVAPQPAKPNLRPYTHRVLQAATIEQAIPEGYWCVFVEAAYVLIRAEQILIPAGLTLDVEDLLDGSIGLRYSSHRKWEPWAGERVQFDYQFPPPSRRCRIVVQLNAYPNAELIHFRQWLRREYLPTHFADYLQRKYGVDGYRSALPHIRRVMPAALASGS